MKTIIIIVLLIGINNAQTVYEETPGTKGNEIKLTVANVSETNPAAVVIIIKSPTKPPLRGGLENEVITFQQEQQTIEMLNPGEEEQITFTFDINRNAPINKKDTIDFVISSPDGILMTKQFIFSYTPPKEFKLEQNFPNPFNPTTTIQYQIAPPNLPQGEALVQLKVYDILGSEVVTLVNEKQKPGFYEVKFNGANIASGMYIYRLQAKDYVSTKKMMVVK